MWPGTITVVLPRGHAYVEYLRWGYEVEIHGARIGDDDDADLSDAEAELICDEVRRDVRRGFRI